MAPLKIQFRKLDSEPWTDFGTQLHFEEPGKLPDGISFVGHGESFVIRRGKTEVTRLQDGESHIEGFRNASGQEVAVRFTHPERE